MGTRHLIIVRDEQNALKVAQYGQWDGFPSGQGYEVLDFLRSIKSKQKMEHFKAQLKKVHFLTNRQIKAHWKKYGADKNGMISIDDSEKAREEHPELHRDTGARILGIVYNNPEPELGLQNEIDFLKDRLYCEWAYEIDLHENQLKVYRGTSLPIATYPLSKLPTKAELNNLRKYND